MKFENLLRKKMKELQQLGNALVYKEKEVLMHYREKLEMSRLDGHPGGDEKASLLAETSSEEEEDCY